MERRKDLTDKESISTRLELYGLGKHGHDGDCNISKPGFFDIVKKKKWEAWNSRKGMDITQAREQFIALAK